MTVGQNNWVRWQTSSGVALPLYSTGMDLGITKVMDDYELRGAVIGLANLGFLGSYQSANNAL